MRVGLRSRLRGREMRGTDRARAVASCERCQRASCSSGVVEGRWKNAAEQLLLPLLLALLLLRGGENSVTLSCGHSFAATAVC